MNKNNQKTIETGLEIAIIGMSGKFPGAGTLDQFWENLKNGAETISFFSIDELKKYGIGDALLNNPNFVKAHGNLTGKENFDSSFFGFSPKEAESLDPQIRLFLECSWETLEDAGYDSTSYKGSIGLYAGIADGFTWRMARVLKDLRTGAEQSYHLLDTSLLLSTRVSHKLDLKGPSITLYTACSTSLVAVHQACRALLTGECDMALAGAVSAQPIDKSGYLYQEGMILSPDGHNRSFDAQAKGTNFGEGIGIVLLKRLKDALASGDYIKCVIKASALNNDGIGKPSYTAPSKKRIADVMRTALKLARLAPETISYIEAHGTATALGDAIEMEALKEVFNGVEKAYCAIGSVKSNIGHLDVAAGMAGLIKTVQAMQHRQIPASLHFEIPNPKIDFIDSPFYINTSLIPWESSSSNLLRAGICSFGIGGTNAFILLEEPPIHADLKETVVNSPVSQMTQLPQLLLLSARTGSALETMARNLVEYFKNNPGVNLADVAYTLQVGRKVFSRRRMIICTNTMEAISALADGIDHFYENKSAPIELLRKTGSAWLEDGIMDWSAFYAQQPGYAQQKRCRIPLPTYPFERQRYWIDDISDDPLSALSLLSQKEEPKDPGISPVQMEKSVEEVTGFYKRPQLSTNYEPPSDELEQILTNIWQRFFGISNIGILDDFFELGGDSLKVITVVTEIHKQMDVRVPIPQVFDTPTIRGLAGYIKSSSVGIEKYAAIEPVEEKEYYPLSSVQMRIYILQQLEIESTGYNNPLLFIWKGPVDRQRVASVFQSLVARHESLRTSFALINGEVVQRIHREVNLEVEYFENYGIAAKNAKVREEKIEVLGSPGTLFQKGSWPPEAIIQSFIRPFDIFRAPLMRVALSELEKDTYLFMVDMHHSITDGSSIGILIREFITLYAGETLPNLRIQYKDYTHWQNSTKQREAVKKQGTYWLGIFEGELPILNLPLDYPRPALQSFEGNRKYFEISREETGVLRNLALKEDATLFMVLFSLYSILLAKICGQEDIVVGTPIAGRSHADLQSLIGMMVNTLALRNAPSGEKTFREFLKEIKKSTLGAFENQDYLFEDLVDRLTRQITRDVSRNPIFDTVFNLLNFGSQYEKSVQIEIPGMSLREFKYERGIAIFDVSLEAVESENGISFNFEFCTKLFKPETIDRLIGYFKNVVNSAADSLDQKIAQIEILSEEERQQILHNCMGPEEELIGEQLIHLLFRGQAKKMPDRMALTAAHELHEITYGELNEQSDRLAHSLMEKGVLPGNIVAIMMKRSIEMVIGIMGILKSGGAYLPIDPGYPQERIEYMLKDSGAKLLATANGFEGEKVRRWEGEKVLLENFNSPKRSSYLLTFLPSYPLKSSNLAYIIYTSGSTGRPKGVMINHRAVVNRLYFIKDKYRLDENDVILQKTSLTFDISVCELFRWILPGAKLCLLPPGAENRPEIILDIIDRHNVTTIDLVPSALSVFLEFMIAFNISAKLSTLRWVFIGAEVVRPGLVIDFNKAISSRCNAQLINGYGPTEATVDVTYFNCSTGESWPVIPIGKPMTNAQVYILDSAGHLQPIGISGELCIGGECLARGYLNRPELTAEKFKINRSNRTYRTYIFYCTGDLARWLNDGNIEFLGRIDNQVKIRGYRIEMQEIENYLLKVAGIKDAVVIDLLDASGNKYLCAYVVIKNGDEEESRLSGLRDLMSKVLPDYMIPSYFIPMKAIPLTSNGKVDRKALPHPETSVIDARETYIAPRNEIESRLVEIWQDVLAKPHHAIGIDDNFFNLGGHSLKATTLISKIHKELNVKITLVEIFNIPTIRELAKYIKGMTQDLHVAIEPVEEREYYVLSSAQKRMYFLQQFDLTGTGYNMPMILPLGKEMEKDKLDSILRQLIDRHESLRTSFEMVKEEVVQRIHKKVEFKSEYYVSSTDYTDYTDYKEEFIHSFIRPFDLSRAPLIRSGLIKLPDGNHIWIVDIHHIVSDGISQMILTEDFTAIYGGKELKPLPIRYKDFALWQKCRSETDEIKFQMEYWLNVLAGEIPCLNLPLDCPRPRIFTFEGDSHGFLLAGEEVRKFKRLGLNNGGTLYMNMLAVLNVLFYKYTGQADIIIGSGIAGRKHADLQGIVGMFINTLVMRNHPEGEKTYDSFLKEVITGSVNGFENQEVQFEDLVDNLDLVRDASRNPVFDIMMVVQNFLSTGEEKGDTKPNKNLNTYEYKNSISKFDMTFFVEELDDDIFINIEYYSAVFNLESIQRLASHLKNIIKMIAADSFIKIKDIEILSDDEKRKLIFEFNNAERIYPKDKTIHRLFEEQMLKCPGRIALIEASSDQSVPPVRHVRPISLTYLQLNEQSDRLAGLLIEKGALTGEVIGIMIERSVELITGILGILKSGCAYLPIDYSAPQERIDYMFKDSNAKILIKNKSEIRNPKFETNPNFQKINVQNKNFEDFIVLNFEHLNFEFVSGFDIRASDFNPLNIAYIIYTSGSTGNPKGVPITHANLCPLLHWGYENLGIGHKDRTLQNISYYFDWSVWEIFITLTGGAALYIVPDEFALNPKESIPFMKRNDITVLHATPAQYQHFISGGQKLETLKYLFLGAEKLTVDMLRHSFASVQESCRVFNMYGPTEASIISAALELKRYDERRFAKLTSIPIGRPLANGWLLILDKYLSLCPVNITGELYIGGDGLAGGYLNNPELTAEKFKINRSNRTYRSYIFYKTGDLARWLIDGNIEFIGRIDHQVKIRGFRIELGEIENCLLNHTLIKETVVLDKPDRHGDKYLCAYIVSVKEFEESELKAYLASHLPSYMIPSQFVQLEKIPLTPNGKIDRKALPEHELKNSDIYVAPINGIETKLVEIWSDILHIDKGKISTHDNFFNVGGHSLKAITLASFIHKEFLVKIPQAEVFLNPTIKGLAQYITKTVRTSYDSIEPAEKKEYYVLSPAQTRLYILHWVNPLSTAYNMPQVIPFAGGLDMEKLSRTFRRLIQRHESLRTSFQTANDQFVQKVHEPGDVEFKIEYYISSTDYTDYTDNKDDKIQQFIHSFVGPFDLSQAPLLRIGLVKNTDESHILLVDIHHIISDGISMNILVKDFLLLHSHTGADDEILNETLSPLRIQYKDFAEWQNSRDQIENIKQQEAYWLREFEEDIPELKLPFNFSRPEIQTFEGDEVNFSIEKQVLNTLANIALEKGVTMYMMFLALINVLLGRLSGQEDIIIGSTSAGRRHADLERIIGMFVNTIALRNYPQRHKSFTDFLQEIKQRTLAAFENQDYPFEDLVDKIAPDRNINRNPLFDVMFNFLDMDETPKEETVLDHKNEFDHETNVSKFDMTFSIFKIGTNNFHFNICYSTQLFKKETIQLIIQSFKNLTGVVVDNPTLKISELEIKSPLEMEGAWNVSCADLENE